MSKIISSIVALFTLISAVFGISRVGNTGEFQNKRWMTDLDGTAYISELSIPGTHDSGALYEPIHPSAKCQNYTISDQLDMGVRFLDIRGVALSKTIGIVHGPVYQSQKFDDVLDTCYSFLKENPGETIIMSVKEDISISLNKKKFSSLVEKYISENSDMWYTENRIPTLDEVRGKIVLFNRYDESAFGLATSEWEDNCSFKNYQQSFTLNVQDYFHIKKVEDKWEQAESLFNECLNCENKSENLFVNFMSGYKGLIPNIPFVAEGMIARFKSFMRESGKGGYGIVLFDYASPELCNMLIDKNI